ncbi:MAG: tail sheath stabilizer and completion protein, partial [Minisyncoccia bacterium]
MFSTTFYHGHLRKYVVLFGTLFNNIYINREKSGVNYDTIKVPISYGPKDKMLARVEADPSLSKPFAIVLPRM